MAVKRFGLKAQFDRVFGQPPSRSHESLFPDLQLFAFRVDQVLIQSGGAQVNKMAPEIVRISVGNARIKCVTPQRVEYFDEAGQECFVDLEECASVVSH
jgi:hypothetical protein